MIPVRGKNFLRCASCFALGWFSCLVRIYYLYNSEKRVVLYTKYIHKIKKTGVRHTISSKLFLHRSVLHQQAGSCLGTIYVLVFNVWYIVRWCQHEIFYACEHFHLWIFTTVTYIVGADTIFSKQWHQRTNEQVISQYQRSTWYSVPGSGSSSDSSGTRYLYVCENAKCIFVFSP